MPGRWIWKASLIALSARGILAQPSTAPEPQRQTIAANAATNLPSWNVVSVHPADPAHCMQGGAIRYSSDGMHAVCVTVLFVVQQAYALLQPTLILNAPDWVKRDHLWNIDAKVAAEDTAAYAALKPSDKYRMMRSALADRFQMKAHMERKEIPVYDLVVAKGGPRLKPASADDASHGHLWMHAPGDLDAVDAAVGSLPLMLNAEVGRAIVDRTGITGHYNITLKYVPESEAATDQTGGPSIFTAIQEQLGLKLQPSRAAMDVLVIDSIELPTTN